MSDASVGPHSLKLPRLSTCPPVYRSTGNFKECGPTSSRRRYTGGILKKGQDGVKPSAFIIPLLTKW
ncbi:MAG: hypothetical protein E6J22_15425 [Chloroflexi bacterium]|nr:MAG: hypothetical protein E6J22_15425 [Chloroflexota bacterium]